jgi:hypothetical protein
MWKNQNWNITKGSKKQRRFSNRKGRPFVDWRKHYEQSAAAALAAQKIADERMAVQLGRERVGNFLRTLVGCLTKCGNRKGAQNAVLGAVLKYRQALDDKNTKGGTAISFESQIIDLIDLMTPIVRNRKQHMGRRLHYIPLPYLPSERQVVPVRQAARWFYESLAKGRGTKKLRARLLQELKSVEDGTAECLKNRLATFRTAVDSKSSVRFFRFLRNR